MFLIAPAEKQKSIGEKTAMNNQFKILPVNGHYEVYVDGNFYCSADTKAEAEHEIQADFGLILS